jgi:hypothetical protein
MTLLEFLPRPGAARILFAVVTACCCASATADDFVDPVNPSGPGLVDEDDRPSSRLPAPGEPTGNGGSSNRPSDGLPPLVIPPAYPHRPQNPAPARPVEPEPTPENSTTRLRPSNEPLIDPFVGDSPTWNVDPRFGLIVLVHESFANRFVQRDEHAAGPVRDCILGAQVLGNQMTLAASRLDFVADGDSARMLIRLDGTVHNNTVGITPQAQVFSRGEHVFRLEKEVDFDGIRFSTRTPSAWVTPRIVNTTAATPLREVPLIGEPFLEPVARMTALTAAEQRRGEAQRIAAERVTAPAARAFNEQADSQLAVLNQALNQLQRTREQLGIAPEEERVHSTRDLVQYSARYHDSLPALPVPVDYQNKPVTGMTLLVNDSLLNAGAGDLQLGGTEFYVREVEEFIERILVHIPGFIPSDPPANPLIDQDLLTVRLDEVDPINVQFLENETHLTFRVSFIPAQGPVVPSKLVTIVYRASITDEMVILTPADVRVTAAPGVVDPIGAVTEDVIQSQFAQRLVPLQFRNGSTITLPDAPSVKITVTELSSHDGWLMLAAE